MSQSRAAAPVRTCLLLVHPNSSFRVPAQSKEVLQTLLLIGLVSYPQETLNSPDHSFHLSIASPIPKGKGLPKAGSPP